MIEERIFFILFASLYIVAKLDSVDISNSKIEPFYTDNMTINGIVILKYFKYFFN